MNKHVKCAYHIQAIQIVYSNVTCICDCMRATYTLYVCNILSSLFV